MQAFPCERLIRKQEFFVIVSKALISKVFQDKLDVKLLSKR